VDTLKLENGRDAGRIIRAAISEFAVGKDVLDVGTIGHFVRYALEAGIASGRDRGMAGESTIP